MQIKGIERAALQVKDIDQSITFFSKLFGTTFQRQNVRIKDSVIKVAFSPLGIELLEEANIEKESLRSFHLRVENIHDVPPAVLKAGGEILAHFTVGEMEHMITKIGDFRIVFVSYEGNDSLKALSPRK
jgi:predicted enzyme related to lactoylglutathione lyase